MKNTTTALGLSLLLIACVPTVSLHAQETAKTKSGKTILVNPNGTWRELSAEEVIPDTVYGNNGIYGFFLRKETTPLRLYCTISVPLDVRMGIHGAAESFRLNNPMVISPKTRYRVFKIEGWDFPDDEYLIGHVDSLGGGIGAAGKPGPSASDVEKLARLTADGSKHKAVIEVRFKTPEEQAYYVNNYDPYCLMPYDRRSVYITNILAIDTWEVPRQ